MRKILQRKQIIRLIDTTQSVEEPPKVLKHKVAYGINLDFGESSPQTFQKFFKLVGLAPKRLKNFEKHYI